MTTATPTRLNDSQQYAAANLVRAIALSDFAAEIRAHEHAQAERHYANLGLDEPCDCEDCTGTPKYPPLFYIIARQLAQFDAAKREAVTTREKRVAFVQKFNDACRVYLGGAGRIRDYFYPRVTLAEAQAHWGDNYYVTHIEASVMEVRGEMVNGVTIRFNG